MPGDARSWAQAAQARLFGVHANTVSKWVRAFRAAGEAGPAGSSHGRAVAACAVAAGPDRADDPRAQSGSAAAAVRALDTRGGQGSRRAALRRAARDPHRRRLSAALGLRSDHARVRSYAPKGITPIVGKTGRRFGCNVIQAVGNRGELWFRVFDGRFTQDVFCDFLARLLRQAAGHKLILVVDGHPAHRGRQARTFVDERKDLLEVVYLPGYSPELNPAEYLTNDTKHGVLTRRPATPDELVGRARSHLHRRQKQPCVVQSFFRHPDVAYAA